MLTTPDRLNPDLLSSGRIKTKLMIFLFLVFGLYGVAQVPAVQEQNPGKEGKGWVLVIHGGAGNINPEGMDQARREIYQDRLREALKTGGALLEQGASALDAVMEVVRKLEDDPLFNAGKGAVLNAEGFAELDAAVMDGLTGKAGAVAGVRMIRNPVTAARRVMETTSNVMLAGQGADQFARNEGLELAEPDYFITPERKADWEKWKKRMEENRKKEEAGGQKGTVGAVALDNRGNLAAATSTGGMMGKMPGRIGDSPVIGAGTWADNASCAVSATGHGEFFIRNVVAYDVSARMKYQNIPLQEAAEVVVMKVLQGMGGTGGLIAVDRNGNVAMPFNTKAMFRGYIKSDGSIQTAIFRD